MKQNKEILIQANKAVAIGDYEGFLSFCTEDTEWTFVGDVTLKGKEAVRQWMAMNYLKPPKFDVKNIISENDFVTVIGEIKIADENAKIRKYSYCDVWRFRDGKMAELKAFVVEIGA